MKKKTKKRWLLAGILITVFFLIFIFLSVFSHKTVNTNYGNAAVINIDGVIGAKSFFGGGVDPEEVVNLIEEADKNKGIDAIIIKINSGGGSPVASEEIVKAIKASNKLTVAVIEDVGASGAYWIASAADVIVASPVSITGSIGVTASYLQFAGLMNKYGVIYEELKAGEYKEIGSPYRNMSVEEKALFQKTLDQLHKYFIDSVKENRGLNEEQVEKVSSAMFFLGAEAEGLGLVDVLGGMNDAKSVIKQRLGVMDVNLIKYSRQKGFFEMLFSELLTARNPGLISNQPIVNTGGTYSLPSLD